MDKLDATAGIVSESTGMQHDLILHRGGPVEIKSEIEGCSRVRVHGDMDLLPAGKADIWKSDRPVSLLRFRILPSLVQSVAEEIGCGGTEVTLAPQSQLRDPQLEHIAFAIEASLENNVPSQRLAHEALGTALIVRLLQRCATPAPASVKAGLSGKQLQRVIDYVEQHIDGDLSLAVLSPLVGGSTSSFVAKFRVSMGVTVHRYVIQRRVHRAQQSLAQGRGVSQASLDAGFANPSHMARWMKRLLGASPLELARQSR